MVGGTVETATREGEHIVVGVIDKPSHPLGKGDWCRVWLEVSEAALAVAPGDDIWWHGRVAYWTPSEPQSRVPAGLLTGGQRDRGGSVFDVPINRFYDAERSEE